jgi:cell filamentation protein
VSEPPRRYSWEDYLYPAAPGQPDVLRNHLGLTDSTLAFVAERALVAGRLQELTSDPMRVPQTFDAAHWKAIHHHLFQDMYEWAGQFRTVGMVNPVNGDRAFCPEDVLEVAAEDFLANVREVGMFADRDKAGVVQGLAATLQGLNFLHPFSYLQ